MSESLIAPSYAEIARLHRHFRLLNGSPEALEYLLSPFITGSSLETWLQTPANLTAFQQLISSPSGAAAVIASSTAMAAVIASSTAMAAVAASSTAMAAVAASSTAMAAVAASSTAMAAVIASSTAMAAVIASSTAMAAVVGSSVARAAVYDSNTAWNAIVASSTAKAALLNASALHNTGSTAHTYPPGSGSGVRVVLVQQRSVSSSYTSFAGANADTYVTSGASFIDRYVRVTGLTHRISSNNSSSEIRYVVMQ